MIRDGEVEAKQMDDGADQPFGLPQRQPEDVRKVSAVAIARAE